MKKLLLLLLSVLCAFSLCACSEKPSTSVDEGPKAIVIGESGPLTGGAAIYGLAVQHGAEIAIEEINAKGGLQFKFVCEDDVHDPEKAVTAFSSLLDQGMQIGMLTTTTNPARAVADLYEENDIFALTPSASGDDVIQNRNNVFQMCFTDSNQGVGSADYMAADETMAAAKIGVLYEDDIVYSKGIFDNFIAEAGVKGLNIVVTESFQDGTVDFNTQLKSLADAGCEVVFLPIYYNEAALILDQANKAGFAPVWFGVDGMDGILDVENFDTALAEGVYLLTPFSADGTDDLTVNFVTKFNAKYDGLNQFAADAYDCVYAIAQACEKGGVTADMSNSEISAILRTQFASMTFDGLTGSGMTWASTGEVSKSPKAVIIKDGVYVGVE